MNGEEALEYLSAPMVANTKRPGDVRCDEAVAKVCKEYRHAGVVPRFYTDGPARRACSVLLMYASHYLSQAALGNKAALVDQGLIAMDVSEAVTLDPHEAGRILDRFVRLVGSVKGEPLLLSSAAQTHSSVELKALIKNRIARVR